MPATYVQIASSILSSPQLVINFLSIPNTYTDLIVKMSVKTTGAFDWDTLSIYLNNDTSALYSSTFLRSDGTNVASTRTTNDTTQSLIIINAANNANVFSVAELYVPNYTASQNRPSYNWGASEANAATAYSRIVANLYRSTTAISQISIQGATTFASGSSFFLYGIKNS